MDVTLLGSGGNFPTPMPTCDCRVCIEARDEGVPYGRAGNATFLHDAEALVDAPEAVWRMLNRERIDDVEYVFLSHHHSDHVRGLRVVQALGRDDYPVSEWVSDPVTVVAGEATMDLLDDAHGVVADYEDWGFVEFETLSDGETLDLGDVTATCLGWEMEPGGDELVYGYRFEEDDSSTVVTPDETKFLDVDRLPDDLDLWIHECGLFREDPKGNRLLTDDLWERETRLEKTFAETVEQVRSVRPERTVLTEIEEAFQRSYDDYRALEAEYADLDLRFGHDGMALSV